MAQIRDFLMPDLGEGLTEGEIARWLVAVGDTVTVDQPVVEMTTEKALVEVPTPFGGTVVTLHGNEGDMIKVGSPLISIDVAARAETQASLPAEPEGSGNVLVGYGTNEASPPRRARQQLRNADAAEPATTAAPRTAPPASPLVRRLAAERGIDLSMITGTGPNGIVTQADLDAVTRSAPAKPSDSQPVATNGVVRQRLTGVDRVAAERLSRSHREIPTATASLTVDATALLEQRATFATRDAVAYVTPFAVLLRLCVLALQRFPRLNAHFDSDTGDVLLHDRVNLGVAVQTDRGLVVPVIRGAETLTVPSLAAELQRLAGSARSGTIAASELSGSTFTVSNFGAFGVDGGTAIINPPEVAILGVGRIAERPWAVHGALTVRSAVELSLVFDHRVADGSVGGGFLSHIGDLIEHAGVALHDD